MPNINPDQITAAILATNCPPLALEEGAALVDHWISLNAADAEWNITAGECGFVFWVDDHTAVIGVQDLLTTDSSGLIGNEWKTTGARSEDDWYDDLVVGSQLAIYALAANQGTYYEKDTGKTFTPDVAVPRIRVRAITKTAVPSIWPKENPEVLTFGPTALDNTRSALIAKAESIRAMRRSGAVPWQLPGIWCTNKYRRQCGYYADCTNQRVPAGAQAFDVNDPAFSLAMPHLGDRMNDPDLVILGASAYAAYSECAEKGRRNTLAGEKEQDMALAIGTVLHAGVAEFYRQLRGR